MLYFFFALISPPECITCLMSATSTSLWYLVAAWNPGLVVGLPDPPQQQQLGEGG